MHDNRPRLPLLGVAGLALMAAPLVAADERFSFVIPGDDASPSITSLAGLSPRPAGADGFVRIQDGHFFTDAGRLRFWGVNTCFAANFPDKADATKVAAHLAKLGVNAVRMHHHDTAAAPRGIWGPVVGGRRTFSTEQLDRQDFFLHELHRHGIYVNLNLHVGREVGDTEGVARAGLPYSVRMDKYLLYYMPPLRAALKEFCRDYLTHDNPYRKLRRIADPGIALIELTNENSFSKLGPGVAASLPEPYRGEFKRQWNAWLGREYASTDALRRAWSGGNEPLGATLADSNAWRNGLGVWRVKQSAAHGVEIKFGSTGPAADAPALLLKPKGGAAAELSSREIQFPALKLEPGAIYTLSFWTRADAPRPLFVDVSNAGPANWNPVGFRETLQLGPAWQRIHRVFRASKDIPGQARLCFKFGDSNVPLALAGVSLRQGGQWIVLPNDQTIEGGSVDIPVAGWSEVAHRDAQRFMEETEAAFVREMMDFLRHELGVRVPITASQINYHPPRLVAATCDYADIHAYWQHPRFPRKPWDPVDWNFPNTPMERAPEADAMLGRAPWRLLGRPYTMSEWNIPDPHDYAASVVPFAAMVAALQDWDGIFFFQYHSGGEGGWYADKVQRYFSFNGQPVKLALFTAFARAFRQGDLAPLPTVASGTLDQMLAPALGLTHRIGMDPKATKPTRVAAPAGRRLASPDGAVVWDASDPEKAHVRMNTPATCAAWGLVGGQEFDLDGWRVTVGATDRNYAVLVLTSMDGMPLEKSRRALLAAVGSAENVGMTWNASRTSVGNQWGTGPAQVNGIPAEITLPRGGARLYALDGRGHRIGEVPPEAGGNSARFRIGPSYRTLWYEVEW